MSLHIIERLHGLYDRVFHRDDAARSAVPESVDDTVTARIVRDDDDDGPDIAGLDVEQLADGELASDTTSEPVIDDDEQTDDGQNWVEALETRTAENGPGPEHAVAPDERRRH